AEPELHACRKRSRRGPLSRADLPEGGGANQRQRGGIETHFRPPRGFQHRANDRREGIVQTIACKRLRELSIEIGKWLRIGTGPEIADERRFIKSGQTNRHGKRKRETLGKQILEKKK